MSSKGGFPLDSQGNTFVDCYAEAIREDVEPACVKCPDLEAIRGRANAHYYGLQRGVWPWDDGRQDAVNDVLALLIEVDRLAARVVLAEGARPGEPRQEDGGHRSAVSSEGSESA